MYCKQCGVQLLDQAKYCHNCGLSTSDPTNNNYQQTASPQYSSYPYYLYPKKKTNPAVYIAIIVAGFIIFSGFVGAILNTGRKTDTPQEPQADSSGVTIETSEETQASGDSSESANLEEAVTFIRDNLSNTYEHYELEYDETGITISVWDDGIAECAYIAQNAGGSVATAWDEMIDSFVFFGKSTREYLDSNGLNDVTVSINILNDQNKDNVLAMIINDIVAYDAVNE